MMRRVRVILAVALGAVALLSAGCSRTHARVSGRVVEDGQPYQHTGEMVQVVMTCDNPSQAVTATVQNDGTFKFYGTEGKGLLAGKYKIGLESDVESVPGVKKRVRNVSAAKSPMEIDLAGGEAVTLTIDLIKHTVSR
jgi:hypothetical protein